MLTTSSADVEAVGARAFDHVPPQTKKPLQRAQTLTELKSSGALDVTRPRFVHRFLIDPRDSYIQQPWDGVQAVALIFTAFVTPFQVAFLGKSESPASALFIIDRVIDAVFVVDMILQFMTMYPSRERPTKDETGTNKRRSGGIEWVSDRKRIAKHYLTTWFPVDFLSIATSLTDIVIVLTPCDETDRSGLDDTKTTETVQQLRLLRVVRVLRLVKLVRLVRASRVLKRFLARLPLNYGSLIIMRMILVIIIASHWFACIFRLKVWFESEPLTTWQGTFGFCAALPALPNYNVSNYALLDCGRQDVEDPCSSSQVRQWTYAQQALVYTEPGLCCVEIFPMYLALLAWSLMIITGTGGTDLVGLGPMNGGISVNDTAVFIVLLLIGCFMWAQVLADFVDVATNANPLDTLFRQTMDDLNAYMEEQRMPKDLRFRLREYFHQAHIIDVEEHHERVVHKMSPSLQREVILRSNKDWLHKLWFIRGADVAMKVQLVKSLRTMVYEPGEFAPDDVLHLVAKGVVICGMEIIVTGGVFGIEGLLLCKEGWKHLRKPFPARAMTFVQCSMLGPTAFFEIVNRCPATKKIVRRSAILMALRRKVIMLAGLETKRSTSGNTGRGAVLDAIFTTAKADVDSNGIAEEDSLRRSGGKGNGGDAELGHMRAMVQEEVRHALHDALEPMHKMQKVLEGLEHGLARSGLSVPAGEGGAKRSRVRKQKSLDATGSASTTGAPKPLGNGDKDLLMRAAIGLSRPVAEDANDNLYAIGERDRLDVMNESTRQRVPRSAGSRHKSSDKRSSSSPAQDRDANGHGGKDGRA